MPVVGADPREPCKRKKYNQFIFLSRMAPACLHVSQLASLKTPAAFSKVYKEECTLCFATAVHGPMRPGGSPVTTEPSNSRVC